MRNKGITLIALVVTIIILLILAAVVISQALGDNGIITLAKKATEKYQNAVDQENYALNDMDEQYDSILSELLEGINGSREMSEEQVNTLINQAVETKLNSALSSYVTQSALNTAFEQRLNNYVTSSSLQSTLNNYQTKNSTILIDTTTPSSLSTWVKVANYPTGCNSSNVYLISYDINYGLGYTGLSCYRDVAICLKSDGIYMHILNDNEYKSKPVRIWLGEIS